MTSLLGTTWPARTGVAPRPCSPSWSHFSTASTLTIGGHAKQSQNKRRKKCLLSNAQWRSIALEKTYVHDVYSLLASKSILLNTSNSAQTNGNDSNNSQALHARVRAFLEQHSEPGSIILDLGCGNTNYTLPNDLFVMIGLDRCSGWFDTSPPNHLNSAITGDVLRLPFKDAFFDSIVCVDVLHHLSTVQRRISALKQISRCLKIGGKVLITVRGPSAKLKNFESRDLLIRVNNLGRQSNDYEYDSDSSFDDSESDSDSENPAPRYSYGNRRTNYFKRSNDSISDSFTSPSSTDLDDCYAFMKRALKRLSMVRNFYAQKNADSQLIKTLIDRKNEHFKSSESEEQLFAIELRNLDPDAELSLQGADILESSMMESCSSSVSGPTTSSSGFFSASFLSNIREHFITWRSQFINNSVWHSLDAKLAIFNESQQTNPESSSHRFSLPLNFLKPESTNSKIILARNKVHVYSSNKPAIVELFSGERSLKLNLPESITSRLGVGQQNFMDSRDSDEISDSNNNNSNHKDLQNIVTPPSSLYNKFQYQSLPNIIEIIITHEAQSVKRHQSMLSLITEHDSQSRKLSWFDDCYAHSIMDEATISLEHATPTPENLCSDFVEPDETAGPVRCKSAPLNRKLLRQRSFSADYQQPEIECYADTPVRRFSASPNIETHRYNNNCHTPHSQQISVDSEESFITIIPAIRSARPSITDPNTFENLTDFDEEDEIELSENDVEDLFSLSDENDDDAYCESLSCTSTDNTSLSSGLELTVKSLIVKNLEPNHSDSATEFSTDTSQAEDDEQDDCESRNEPKLFHDNTTPPSILHCFYHVFSSDELENIIRNYITDLDLLESFFEPETGTWCIVAEKIRVWTI